MSVPAAMVLAGLALLLAGCSSGLQGWYGDTSGEPWRVRDGACVRESEERPTRRVVNYADPELCGRERGRRDHYHVRVPPRPEERE